MSSVLLDAELEARIRELCRAAGLRATHLEPLAAGLSRRQFARVHTDSAEVPSLVARIDAAEDPAGRPAGAAPEPPHEPIRALLEARGLPVPRRFGGDASIELLEDLGPRSLREAAAGPDREALYREACGWVVALQRIPPDPELPAFRRRLDAELFAYKGRLLAETGLAARGRPASAAERRCVEEAFARIAAELAEAPQRLAHRDYQSANLFVTADGSGTEAGHRLRMIDFQGAFLAPPEYDLVCLLRDSYVELGPEEQRQHAEATRPALPDAPPAELFWRRFDWLTLTRKGKDYARFVEAARRRGEAGPLAALPTTVRHLRRAARAAAGRDPWLAPLAELIEALPEHPCAR